MIRSVLPSRTRRNTLLVASLAPLAIFALLAKEALNAQVAGWDARLLEVLHGHEERSAGSVLDRSANALLGAGGGDLGTLTLGLIVVSILLFVGRVLDAVFLVALASAVTVLTLALKEVFQREELKYSFPSGHAALSAAVASAMVLIAWPTSWRWPALAVGALFTFALGTSLVYEDWHLPSDVIGGWCLAVACACLLRAVFVARGPASLH